LHQCSQLPRSSLTVTSCLAFRNAAKARSKDATGRLQKNYFGRQRLEALTKGLRTQTPANPLGQMRPADKARSEINLAHAKRDVMQRTGSSYVTPATPQRKSYVPQQSSSGSRGNSSTGSSLTRSSKVLSVLDTSERMWI
jgi:hypothetical protein